MRLQISSYEAAIDLQTTPFGVLMIPGHDDALITLRSARSFVPVGCELIYSLLYCEYTGMRLQRHIMPYRAIATPSDCCLRSICLLACAAPRFY